MKVLVTGAAGLLGSHVAELALKRGNAVRLSYAQAKMLSGRRGQEPLL